jgi:hypothetical protein
MSQYQRAVVLPTEHHRDAPAGLQNMSAGSHEALYRAFLLRCMSPNLAQSGHTETRRYLSAFGGKADVNGLASTISVVSSG